MFIFLSLLLFLGSISFCNDVSNSSFENGLEGWTCHWSSVRRGDRFELDTNTVKDGKYSFKASLKNENSKLSLFTEPISVVEGEVYRSNFFYYTETNNNNCTLSYRLIGTDKDGQFMGYYNRRTLPPTANLWIQCDIIGHILEGVANIQLEFVFEGTGDIQVDQISYGRAFSTEKIDYSSIYPNNEGLWDKLFVPGTKPDKARVYPYWTYYVSSNYRDTATILGVEHSSEAQFKEAAEYSLAPFYHSFYRNFPELTKKYKTPVMYYPMVNALAKVRSKKLSENGRLWGNDPEFLKAYLEVIEEMNFAEGLPEDIPQVTFIADEWIGFITNLELAQRDRELWEKVNEEIKEKYGFGKFSAPANTDDSDPYKRIAWFRYNADQSVHFLKEVSSALRAKYPNCKILGFDEWSAATAHDWSRLGPLVDMQPAQSLPLEEGYRRFSPAFISKFHKDLSGADVYPYLQFIKYPSSISIDTLYEWCDSLFQGGARGIYVGTVEWYDRSLGHPAFSDPEKWEAMLNIVKRTNSMPDLRYPAESKMALHFGSYSLMAKFRSPENKLYPAFSLLGPRCRSWFTITDDFQIERDSNHWNQFDTVVITEQKFISENMQKAIANFLDKGGTLLVLDQDAFQFRIDGIDLNEYREQLFGAKISHTSNSSKKIHFPDFESLPNSDSFNYKIDVLPGVEYRALASFDDGSPALLERKVGKGKILLCGFAPANDYIDSHLGWIQRWRKWLQDEMNIKVDEDIWRFQIPRDPLKEKIWKKYTCVSGNALQIVKNEADTSMNLKDATMSYKYKIQPKLIPDNGNKLTNRREMKKLHKNTSGTFTERDKVKRDNWLTSFGKDETQANEISFTFNEKYPLRHGRIFFTGTIPAGKIEAKKDGQWLLQDSFIAQNVGRDIAKIDLKLQEETKELRIVLEEREANSTLSLIEIDFWAEQVD